MSVRIWIILGAVSSLSDESEGKFFKRIAQISPKGANLRAGICVRASMISCLLDFYLFKTGLVDKPTAPPEMVVVAQLVEPRIVIPVVAGSSPVDHPIFLIGAASWAWKGGEETS